MEIAIRTGGIIKLPNHIMTKSGLNEGKKVALSAKGREILMKPIESVTKRITGSIELDDEKLI